MRSAFSNQEAFVPRPYLSSSLMSFICLYAFHYLFLESQLLGTKGFLELAPVYVLALLFVLIVLIVRLIRSLKLGHEKQLKEKRTLIVCLLKPLLITLILLLLSYLVCSLKISSLHKQEALAQGFKELSGIARVVSDERKNEFGSKQDLEIIAIGAGRIKTSDLYQAKGLEFLEKPLLVEAQAKANQVMAKQGQLLVFQGRYSALDRSNEFDLRSLKKARIGKLKIEMLESLDYQKGIFSFIFKLRQKVLDRIFPEQSPEAAFLAGIFTGYSTELSSFNLREQFARTGLSHMVAVSGTHLAIVLACLKLLLERLRLNKFVLTLLLILLSGIYVVFTGLQVSAMRAWIMACLIVLAPVFKRRAQSLSALGLTACIMLLVDPLCVYSLSFQLSFLSVFGILVFANYLKTWIYLQLPSVLQRSFSQALCSMIAISLICQLITLPLTVPLFTYIPISSIICNILIAPLLSISLMLSFVWQICAFIWEPLSLIFAPMILFICKLCLFISSIFAQSPFMVSGISQGPLVLAISVILIFSALYMTWRKPHKLPIKNLLVFCTSTGFVVFLACYAPMADGIYALDIGQGDAIYLKSRGESLLVDVGDKDEIKKALARNHIFRLDALLITHLDKDHVGGLPALAQSLSFKRLYLARGVKEHLNLEQKLALLDAEVEEIVELDFGDELRVGNFNFRQIWPREIVDGHDNEDSVVLLGSLHSYFHGDLSILLTGDAEHQINQDCIDRGLLSQVDLLKLGHHGAKAGLTFEQARILSPRFALISCGKNNRYGHPHKDILSYLEAVGSKILRTDQSSDVGIALRFWGYTCVGD